MFIPLFCLTAMAAHAAPAVATFSPAMGQPGTQVIVSGSGFSTATIVQFDAAIADFVATADNRLVTTVPLNATTGKIRVTNPTGTGVSGPDFVVAPRITEFTPLRSAPGTIVTIDGSNFTGTTNVLFNTRTSVFAVTAPTQIRATVPAGATNGPITVRTPAGSATTTNAFVVSGPAPVIDGFSPTAGAPGTLVLIEGINFTNVQAVRFNGVIAAFSAPAHTQISATVPATATTGRITVQTPAGTATSSNNFFVTRAPIITNFFPTFGTVGTPVTIEGVNFNNLTGIGFAGRPVSGWGTPAPNQISVTVPNGATNGLITVTNTSGVGTSSNDFVVTRAPIITDFSPTNAAPGAVIVINGANFTGVPNPGGVKFNGRNAANVAVTADTQIHATVPTGATSGPLTITNSFGATTSTDDFFVIGNAPFISEFSPGNGPRGTEVIIGGKNFTSPATIRFNGVADPTAAVTALTQIRATVPATATAGPITVTTSAGTSTNANIFYVPPRLTSLTPTNGIVGSSIVLTGANFVGVSSVLFNTGGAAFTINASNKLTAVVPTNATTGPVTVITPGGVIISTNSFRVQPHITAFSPMLGPVGTVVTINGTSFLNVTNVSFNNVSALFTNVSSTEVRATVPLNATTGPIRVATPDGAAVSPTNFLVTVPSDLALAMSVSATLIEPNLPLTYTLVVTNRGSSIVTGVNVTNTLPPDVAFVSADSTRGNCVQNGGLVTCAFGTFTNGTGETITIVVTPASEGDRVNTATVRSVEPDTNPSDNTASVLTTVVSDESRTLQIRLASGGAEAVISWPASPVVFLLESLERITSSNVWQVVTNNPVPVNGRNTVTNSTTGESRFYRLRK